MFVPARQRSTLLGLALLGAPHPVTPHATADTPQAESRSTESDVVPPGWRAELGASGAWLPTTREADRGGELRHSHGFRLGGGYERLSFGFEYALYRLGREGSVREFDMYWPWLGVSFDLGGSVRASLEAALGFGTAEYYEEHPVTPRVRAGVLFIEQAFGAGPFISYAHNFGSGPQDDYRGDDPVPFGFEFGGSFSVWAR